MNTKKPLQRISILAAGAAMNLLLGFVALVILFAPNENISTTRVEIIHRPTAGIYNLLSRKSFRTKICLSIYIEKMKVNS